MKKRVLRKISFLLVVVMSMSLVVGCNRKLTIDYGFDSADYITKLGEYKGVEYTPDNRVIEESVIDEHIDDVCEQYTNWIEYFTDKAKMGDKLTIQIQANDEEGMYLPEFSYTEDYDLVLGSGIMSKNYENFEESMVGAIPGFSKQIKCKISDDFAEEEYRGQTITFTVSVIAGFTGERPEVTDKFVSTITEGRCETVEAYRKYLRDYYEGQLEDEKYENRYAELIDTIIANTEVSSYPEAVLQKQIETTTTSMKLYATMNGVEPEEYCQSMFNCSIEEFAQKVILQDMILQEVAKKEKLTLTTKEYKDNVDRVATDAGYSDTESFVEKYGEEYIQMYMMKEKAMEVIYDSSVPKAE